MARRLSAKWVTGALSVWGTAFDSEKLPKALSSLDAWTEKRHRIVHRGELVKLTRPNAGALIQLVKSIGRTLNDRAVEVLYS